MFVSLPYVAMCAWLSGLIDSPFGALTICLLLTGFPVLFLSLLSTALRVEVADLHRILPWGWKYDLLSADVGTRFAAYGVMLAFTSLFLWLGLRSFQKRDL